MRVLPVLLLLACASPAAAQIAPVPYGGLDPLRQADLQFQAQELQRRSVDLDTQLMALEARLRTEQSIATVQAQSARPYISQPYVPPYRPGAAVTPAPSGGDVDTSKLVSIPDDRLAASNAAVRAVTQAPRH